LGKKKVGKKKVSGWVFDKAPWRGELLRLMRRGEVVIGKKKVSDWVFDKA
jgi:hypothetical protein